MFNHFAADSDSQMLYFYLLSHRCPAVLGFKAWSRVTCWENGYNLSPTGDGLDGGACHNTALLHRQGATAEN